MNCSEIDQLLAERLTGELSPADATQLDRHLQSCPACASKAAEYKDLECGFASLRQAYDRVSPPFVFQPGDTGTALPAPSRKVFSLMRVSLAAAAVLVALLSIWPLITLEGPVQQHEPVAEAPAVGTAPMPRIERTPTVWVKGKSVSIRSAAFVTRLPSLTPATPSRPTGAGAVRLRMPSLYVPERSKPNVTES